MADASHTMAKPAPQSVALDLPPISHTGSLPSARTAGWEPACLALLRTLFQGISLVINPQLGQFIVVLAVKLLFELWGLIEFPAPE